MNWLKVIGSRKASRREERRDEDAGFIGKERLR